MREGEEVDPRVLDVLEQWFLAQEDGRELELREACGGDLELEASVRTMIASGPAWITDPDNGHPKKIGPYEVLGPIAKGGMGAIYRCQSAADERAIAVKILDPQFLPDPTSRARFRREAELTASLAHDNIVEVFGVGESEGRIYIAMECLEGPALHQLEGLTPVDVARIGASVADALDAAHVAGVIHRDVKPANVLMHEGRPVLVDFGLARSAANPRLTRTGTVPGTLHYLAPELLHSRGAALDPRTDVYSLGATLYELIAGHPPFREQDPDQLIRDILLRQPPPLRLSGDARQLEVLIFACLSKDPAHRPRDAGFLAAELRRVAASRAIQTRRPSTATRLWRLARRFPRAASATVLALGMALAFGAWFWSSTARAAERRSLSYADVQRWASAGEHSRVVDGLRALEVESPLPERLVVLGRISRAELALSAVIGGLNARVESMDRSGLRAAVGDLESALGRCAQAWDRERADVAAAALCLAARYLGDERRAAEARRRLPAQHPVLVAMACDPLGGDPIPSVEGLSGDLALLAARALHLNGAALEQVRGLALRALDARSDAGLFLAELHRRRGDLTRAEELLRLLPSSPSRTRLQAGIHLRRNETDRVRELLPSGRVPTPLEASLLWIARQRELDGDPAADWLKFAGDVRDAAAQGQGVPALMARIEAMARSRAGENGEALRIVEAALDGADPVEVDLCRALRQELRRRLLPARIKVRQVRALEADAIALLDGERCLRLAEARAIVHVELAQLYRLLGEAAPFREHMRAAIALRPDQLMEPAVLLDFELLAGSAAGEVLAAQQALEDALQLVIRERLPIADGGEAQLLGLLRRAAAITETGARVEALAGRLR